MYIFILLFILNRQLMKINNNHNHIKKPKQLTLQICSKHNTNQDQHNYLIIDPNIKINKKYDKNNQTFNQDSTSSNTLLNSINYQSRPSLLSECNIHNRRRSYKQQKLLSNNWMDRGSCINMEQNNNDRDIKNRQIKCFERIFYKISSLIQNLKKVWQLDRLNYKNIISILYRLQYIKSEQQNSYEQNKKIYKFWLYLNNHKVSLQSVLLLICAIQNIKIDIRFIKNAINQFIQYLHNKDKYTQNQSEQEYQIKHKFQIPPSENLHIFNQQNIISTQYLPIIQQQFKLFILNRLNHNTFIQIQSHSFNPKLSEKTIKLAQKRRNQIINILKNKKPFIKNITLTDILNFKLQNKKISNNNSILQCTFKPQNNHHQTVNHKTIHLNINQLSKPKTIPQKSKQDIQYIKQKQQCTFHPQIHQLKKSRSNSNTFHKIKNVQKSIQRMKQGRLFKNEKQQKMKSGWTNLDRKSKDKALKSNININNNYNNKKINFVQKILSLRGSRKNQKIQTLKQEIMKPSVQIGIKMDKDQQQVQQERTPILYIDINIDRQNKQRIIIYENDTSEGLAREFSRKHNLNKQTQDKLRQLLQYQMSTLLTKIQEQINEDEFN